MERIERSVPIKEIQQEEIVNLTRGLVAISNQHFSLDELRRWGDNAEIDPEMEVFRNLYDAILHTTTTPPDEIVYGGFIGLVNSVAESCISIGTLSEEAHAFVEENLSLIDSLISEHNGEGIDKLVKLLSIKTTPRTEEYIKEHFADAVAMSEDIYDFDWIIEDLSLQPTNDLVPDLIQRFKDVIGRDPKLKSKILAWSDVSEEVFEENLLGSSSYHSLLSLKEHVNRLIELEEEAPGSTLFLMEEYNIYYFSRYPKQLLLDQYESRHQRSGNPYGVVIESRHDWNHSTRRNKGEKKIDRFYKQVKEAGYELRVMEVATKEDLHGQTRKVADRFGKANFAVIRGHANPRLIQLGDEEGDNITYDYLDSEESEIITDLLKDNATVILGGCKLGVMGGFAQKLSERGFTVIASNANTSLRGISFFPEENPPISVNFYRSKHTNLYKDGNMMVREGEYI